jgi:hypothetical protein
MKPITSHHLPTAPSRQATANFEVFTLLALALCSGVVCAKNDDALAQSMPPPGLYTSDLQSRVVRNVGGKTATIETQTDGKTGSQVVTTTMSGSPAVVQRYEGKGPVLRCIRPVTTAEALHVANATQNTPCPIVQHAENLGTGNMKAVCSASNAVVDWKYAPTNQKEVWTLTYKVKMNADMSLGAIPAQLKDAAGTARAIEALAGSNMTDEERKKLAKGREQLEQATAQAQSSGAEQKRMQAAAAMEREIARMPPEQQAAMRQQMARMRGGAGAMEPTVADATERLTLSAATCPPGM